jgi:hypothetical protein
MVLNQTTLLARIVKFLPPINIKVNTAVSSQCVSTADITTGPYSNLQGQAGLFDLINLMYFYSLY